MGYAKALTESWDAVMAHAGDEKTLAARMLGDRYTLDTHTRVILSDSCNVPPKEAVAIIILHYLARSLQLKGLPAPSGEWVDFRTFEGGEAYYPTFKKRTIDRIVTKFGKDPAALRASCGRYPSRPGTTGDTGVIVDIFPEIPVLIALYRGDEEFGPGASILFDRNLGALFPTEDIVVMTEILIHAL